MAEKDRAVFFQLGRQRDIVDQRALDALQPADAVQRLAPHQHRAARRRRGGAKRVVHLRERVEHLEEVDEGRDQEPLRPGAAVQPHHLRDHVHTRAEQPRHQRGEVPAVMGDVGIGEEQNFRAAGGHTLAQRPELAGPAGRLLLAGDDGELLMAARRAPPCRRWSCRPPESRGTGRHNPAPPARRSPGRSSPPRRGPE